MGLATEGDVSLRRWVYTAARVESLSLVPRVVCRSRSGTPARRVPATTAPVRSRFREVVEADGSGLLRGVPPGVLDPFGERAEEAGGVGTVDDSVVEAQIEGKRLAERHAVVVGLRPLPDPAHAEDGDFRRVDDRREPVVDAGVSVLAHLRHRVVVDAVVAEESRSIAAA